MSEFIRNSYKKRKLNKPCYQKIKHVYTTKDDEKIWVVKTVDGKRRELSKHVIDKYKLVTNHTTFTVRKMGCKARYGVGKEFRIVFWEGFNKPTREPYDFEPTSYLL
jgi:hypothetical protein